MLQHISVAVDPAAPAKGDVIIIKRTYFDPNSKTQLKTICTKCGDPFDTQLRRMQPLDNVSGKRRCEVRNIPQCPSCRSSKKKPSAFPALPVIAPTLALPAPMPLYRKGQKIFAREAGPVVLILCARGGVVNHGALLVNAGECVGHDAFGSRFSASEIAVFRQEVSQ